MSLFLFGLKSWAHTNHWKVVLDLQLQNSFQTKSSLTSSAPLWSMRLFCCLKCRVKKYQYQGWEGGMKGKMIQCVAIKEPIAQGSITWILQWAWMISELEVERNIKSQKLKSSGRGEMRRPVVSSKNEKDERIIKSTEFQRSWVFDSLFSLVYLFSCKKEEKYLASSNWDSEIHYTILWAWGFEMWERNGPHLRELQEKPGHHRRASLKKRQGCGGSIQKTIWRHKDLSKSQADGESRLGVGSV